MEGVYKERYHREGDSWAESCRAIRQIAIIRFLERSLRSLFEGVGRGRIFFFFERMGEMGLLSIHL